jgi:hypothetical protein
MIIEVLKESEASVKIADLCRKPGVSGESYFDWKYYFQIVLVDRRRQIQVLYLT